MEPTLASRLVKVLLALSVFSICLYLGLLFFNSGHSSEVLFNVSTPTTALDSLRIGGFLEATTENQSNDKHRNSTEAPGLGLPLVEKPLQQDDEEGTQQANELPESLQATEDRLNTNDSAQHNENSGETHSSQNIEVPSKNTQTNFENLQLNEQSQSVHQTKNEQDYLDRLTDERASLSKWLTQDYLDTLSNSLVSHDSSIRRLDSAKMSQIPQLESDLSCQPSVFGYNQQQADAIFSPDVTFEVCGNPQDSCIEFSAATNELTVTGGHKYALGTNLYQEEIGGALPPLTWINYTEPVTMRDTEFAYADCNGDTQTLLVNKPKDEAKARAQMITSAIAEAAKVTPRPLSVITLMYDSMSRYHFFRNFKKSMEYLNSLTTDSNNSTVVYDFILSNGSGENTSPNMVPMMWGRDMGSQYKRVQSMSESAVPKGKVGLALQQDALWKHFESHGFVSMFSFDASWDFIIKASGRNISVDHPVFNFWKTATSIYSYHSDSTEQRCFGLHDASFYMLDYVVQFVKNYDGLNRFAYIHLTTAHEPTGTVIRTADEDNRNTLKALIEHFQQRPDEDFIILLMGDHGIKITPWEESLEGYKENQLPGAFVIANQRLMNSLNAHEVFQTNSRRLTSRIDWFLTYKHLATVPYGKLTGDSPLYHEWKHGRERFHSMFIEENEKLRTCESLKIPFHVCSCLDYEDAELKDTQPSASAVSLAALGIEHVNKKNANDQTEGICMKLTAESVVMLHTTIILPPGELVAYRVRASISQSPTVFFDVMGFGTTSVERTSQSPFIQGSPALNPLLSVENAVVQVNKVDRVDSYKGLCEELAKIIESNSPFCICEDPQQLDEKSLVSSSKLTELYSILLSRLQVHVSEPGTSCDDTCKPLYRSCMDWGLQLLNSQAVLHHNWPTGGLTYSKDGATHFFSDLKVTAATESEVLTLRADNTVSLGSFSTADCALQEANTRYICPCG